MIICLRKLEEKDAKISWKWRNDPEVWKQTGRKWNNVVTYDIEREWIKKVRKEKDSIRFAICVGDSKEYIGNIQLTNIEKDSAKFHLFIGEKKFWGKGIGSRATELLIEYAKTHTSIKEIELLVMKENKAALRVYEKSGFIIKNANNKNISMIYKLE